MRKIIFYNIAFTFILGTLTRGAAIAATTSEQATGHREIELMVSAQDAAKSIFLKGRRVFQVQLDGTPSNNLQAIGDNGSTIVLASLEPYGPSGQVYWVKLNFLDRNTGQVTKATTAQLGFRSRETKESDPVILDIATNLIAKNSKTSSLEGESDRLIVTFKLRR